MAAPHVLVFPFPIQGHINSMLHFATALAGAGVHVTFLLTEHNLRRLDNRASSGAGSPRLRFLSVPDGLHDDHPRSAAYLPELYKSLAAETRGPYRDLLARLSSIATGSHSSYAADAASEGLTGGFPPVTCLVADGLLGWAVEVAGELGVPAIVFRTASAGSLLAFMSVPKLFELGELPFPVAGDLDEPVRGVPGMETILRRRDLPGHCRRPPNTTYDVNPGLHRLAQLSAKSGKARALVLNSTATLEGTALEHIAPRVRDLFAIGPVHAMSSPAAAASCSLLREDAGCMAWLDGQPDRSVVYASLGSLATISREQFDELFSGLVATGYPFLWVLRPDMVAQDTAALQDEAVRAAGDVKGRVVAWAPQREVLRHRAVGCFLTHAGWNSTLEAVVEGVPMVCWPSSADQQMNSRFVGAVWRNGLDMKDVCDRAVVERTVREAMESTEIRESAQAMAQQVKRDVAAGGSSATEFERLVGLIRELKATSGLSQ